MVQNARVVNRDRVIGIRLPRHGMFVTTTRVLEQVLASNTDEQLVDAITEVYQDVTPPRPNDPPYGRQYWEHYYPRLYLAIIYCDLFRDQ